MTGYESKKKAALDEEGMYLVHQTDHQGEHMTKDKALKLALEVNESMKDVLKQVNELIAENKALKEALAQPAQQEPVFDGADMLLIRRSQVERTINCLNTAENAGLRLVLRDLFALLQTPPAQPAQEPVCDKDPQGCWNVRCQLGKKCKNTPPQRTWVGLTDEELIGIKKDAERYRWLRKEYAESRETYLAECVPSENALDEYIDRQMAKTSIKTERWSGK